MRFSLGQRAIFSLVVVAFSYALLSVVVRMMANGFGPFTQVYLRIGLGCLLTAVFFYKKIRFFYFRSISKRDWLYLLMMGALGYGLAVDFATLGTLYTKLLDVSVILSTTPFFVFIFAITILRKSFHKYLLLLMLLSFYGVCVLATKSLIPVFNQFALGDFYVLLFAFGFSLYILGRKLLSPDLNTYEISVITMGIATVVSFIVAIGLREPFTAAGFFNPIALIGLILGGVLNLIATNLETFGFNNINAVAGSQILLLENIFAPIFGFVFYKEYIVPVEIFGALLVVVSVWLYIKYED